MYMGKNWKCVSKCAYVRMYLWTCARAHVCTYVRVITCVFHERWFHWCYLELWFYEIKGGLVPSGLCSVWHDMLTLGPSTLAHIYKNMDLRDGLVFA